MRKYIIKFIEDNGDERELTQMYENEEMSVQYQGKMITIRINAENFDV